MREKPSSHEKTGKTEKTRDSSFLYSSMTTPAVLSHDVFHVYLHKLKSPEMYTFDVHRADDPTMPADLDDDDQLNRWLREFFRQNYAHNFAPLVCDECAHRIDSHIENPRLFLDVHGYSPDRTAMAWVSVVCSDQKCAKAVERAHDERVIADLNLKETLMTPDPIDMCQICEEKHTQLKHCGQCGRRSYCSAQCQRWDWPTHRLVCVKKGKK